MRRSLQPNKEVQKSLERNLRSSSTKKMHEFSTLNWFKKRCPKSTKDSYLYSAEELSSISMATEVFVDYDQDKSGTLEIEEIYSMFQHNGINISRRKLCNLFGMIKTKQKNKLNLEEFKELTFSNRANNYFKDIMREAKNELATKGKMSRHLPLDFKDMLRVLYDRSRQEKIINQIDFHDAKNDFQLIKNAFNMNTDLSSTKSLPLKTDALAHQSFIKKMLDTSTTYNHYSLLFEPRNIDTTTDSSLQKIPHMNSKSTHFTVCTPEPLAYKPITKVQIPATLKQKLVKAHIIGASVAEDEISSQLFKLKNKRPVSKSFFRSRTGRSLSRGLPREYNMSNKSQVNFSMVVKDSQADSFFSLNSSSFRYR